MLSNKTDKVSLLSSKTDTQSWDYLSSTHLNTKVIVPKKQNARPCAKASFQLLGGTSAFLFPDVLKNGAFVLTLSLFSDALALWTQIKFKVAHQVCARGVSTAPRRASSSELSTGCFVKVVCILIGCALCLRRQGHWHLANTPRW